MHLQYDTTIHLSHDDVVKIIKEYLYQVEGVNVDSISFNITKELCGLGPGEHECINFKGVVARCSKNENARLPVDFNKNPITASNDSWQGEVDKQSGAFTQEEIARSNEWR